MRRSEQADGGRMVAETSEARGGFLRPLGALVGAGGVRLVDVPVDRLLPNPDQPRRRFDPRGMRSLTASVRRRGVLQPVLVRRVGRDFVLVAGERRWRAARAAGLRTVPAIVREDGADPLELALLENLQREHLHPRDEAEALAELRERLRCSERELTQLTGRPSGGPGVFTWADEGVRVEVRVAGGGASRSKVVSALRQALRAAAQ